MENLEDIRKKVHEFRRKWFVENLSDEQSIKAKVANILENKFQTLVARVLGEKTTANVYTPFGKYMDNCMSSVMEAWIKEHQQMNTGSTLLTEETKQIINKVYAKEFQMQLTVAAKKMAVRKAEEEMEKILETLTA